MTTIILPNATTQHLFQVCRRDCFDVTVYFSLCLMSIPKPKSEEWATKVLEGWDCNGFQGGFDNAEAIWLVKLLNWHLATVNLPVED